MSYAPEVIADPSGKWTRNGLRFATEAEAIGWVSDLWGRWTLVTDTRAVQTDDPVNYQWTDHGLEEVTTMQKGA